MYAHVCLYSFKAHLLYSAPFQPALVTSTCNDEAEHKRIETSSIGTQHGAQHSDKHVKERSRVRGPGLRGKSFVLQPAMGDEFVVALYTSAAVPETSTPALTLDEPMLLVKAHDSGWLEVLTVNGSTGFVPPAWVRAIREDERRAADLLFNKSDVMPEIPAKMQVVTSEFGFGEEETTTTTTTAPTEVNDADNNDDDDARSNITLQQQRQRQHQQSEQDVKYSRPTSLEISKPSIFLPPPPPDDDIATPDIPLEPTKSPRPSRAAPPVPNADGDAAKKPQRNAPPPPAARQKSVLDTAALLNPQQLQQMGRPAPKPPRPEPPRLPVRTDVTKSSERPDIVPTVERTSSTGKKAADEIAAAISRTGSNSMPQPAPAQPSESEPATVCFELVSRSQLIILCFSLLHQIPRGTRIQRKQRDT